MRNSGKTLLGLVLQQEGAKISNGIPCLLPERGRAGPLGVMVGAIGGSGQRGGLGGLSTPLVMLCAGIILSTCFWSWHLRNGSWVLAVLYHVVHNLPQLSMHRVIFSPLQFLCILLLREMFVQVQALQ